MKCNKQDSGQKMINITEDFKAMLTAITYQIYTLKYSSTQKYSPNPQEHTTAVPDNRSYPPLYGGKYTKNGGMWTLKHEIISPKFYELIINK